MTGSIIASILYVTGFVLCFAAIFLLPKSEQKLNGVMWLVLSLLAEMCWGGFVAAIINIVHIPINIYSMGIVYLVSAVLLGVKSYREKKIQSYEWSLLDILFSLGVFLLVGYMVLKKAGTDLNLVFVNSDAAVHLKNAVSVVLNQELPTMYFAPFQTAMVLEVMMPAVPIYDFYKVFFVIDAFLFAVEVIFFFLFCQEYLKKKWMKVIGIFMCIFYAAGYPLLSYIWTFYYWALGVMLMGMVTLLVRMYRKNEIRRNYILLLLMLSCNGVTMCYMLIGPMTFIAAFLCLAVTAKSEGKLVTKGNVLMALKVFLAPTLLAIYYCYFEFLRKQGMSATEVISIEGGIYRELYVNFLFVMPIVAYMVVHSIYKRKADENMIFFLTLCAFVLVLFVLAVKLRVSGYYYYKFYYPLWFYAFVLAIQGMEKMLEKHWEVLVSYGLVFVFLFGLHFGGIERKIVESSANFQTEEHAGVLFDLYDNNRPFVLKSDITFSKDYMDICKYVVDELESEKDIPLIATQENYEKCYWYEAITGEDSSDYYGWWHKFKNVRKKLDGQKVEFFAVFKDSPVFEENEDYFTQFEVVYENETGVIYRTR